MNVFREGPVRQVSFGADNYVWHAKGAKGYARPDRPPVIANQSGGKGVEFTLPTASVLRGTSGSAGDCW